MSKLQLMSWKIFEMKIISAQFVLNYLVGLLILTTLSISSYAHDHNEKRKSEKPMAEQVKISNAWARATFALAKTGAAYMDIENVADSSVHLVSANVAEKIAATTEIHHTVMKGEMMQMQELDDGVVLASGENVAFVPGGKHIMLMGLNNPLNKGESVEIQLVFSDGSIKTHNFKILDKRNSSGASHKHH